MQKKIATALCASISFAVATGQISTQLIPFRYGEFWGYCTPDKKIVIPPQYDFADWFRDGLAFVGRGCQADCWDTYDGVVGFIDSLGREVVPLKYSWGVPFKKGVGYVSELEEFFKVDRKGKLTPIKENEWPSWEPLSQPDDYLLEGKFPGFPFRNQSFKGYKSPQGTTYWDDPETVFFLPVFELNKDEHLPGKYHVVLNYDLNILQQGQPGKKLKPGLALVTLKDNKIEAEQYFPLEFYTYGTGDSDNGYFSSDVASLKPYVSFIDPESKLQKLMFTASFTIPYDSVKEGLLFRIYQRGIVFISTDFGQPILDYFGSLRELHTREGTLSILSRMAGDIQMTARNMRRQGDPQNLLIEGESNPYAGKYLFDVMENVTPGEVRTFLEYVDARPFPYMGGRWKISEAFATWAFNGAPRPVKK